MTHLLEIPITHVVGVKAIMTGTGANVVGCMERGEPTRVARFVSGCSGTYFVDPS